MDEKQLLEDSPLKLPKWMYALKIKSGKWEEMIPPEITVYNPDGTTYLDRVYLHNALFDIPTRKSTSLLRRSIERVKYYLALLRSR